jgi:hypothetical protein
LNNPLAFLDPTGYFGIGFDIGFFNIYIGTEGASIGIGPVSYGYNWDYGYSYTQYGVTVGWQVAEDFTIGMNFSETIIHGGDGEDLVSNAGFGTTFSFFDNFSIDANCTATLGSDGIQFVPTMGGGYSSGYKVGATYNFSDKSTALSYAKKDFNAIYNFTNRNLDLGYKGSAKVNLMYNFKDDSLSLTAKMLGKDEAWEGERAAFAALAMGGGYLYYQQSDKLQEIADGFSYVKDLTQNAASFWTERYMRHNLGLRNVKNVEVNF